jgi:hypothetical protein
MPKRPTLSADSFLAHIFSPKKHAQPVGLRKTHLSGRQWNKRRLAAYNRMTAVQQETLKRAGTRDHYLKGESTLAEAKRKLRETAVQLGVAKPVRTRTPKPARPLTRAERLDKLVADHLIRTIESAGKEVNLRTVNEEMPALDFEEGMLRWSYGKIKYEGRKGSDYEYTGEDGRVHNPLWYH